MFDNRAGDQNGSDRISNVALDLSEQIVISSQFTSVPRSPAAGLLRLVKPTDSVVVTGFRQIRPAQADVRFVERPLEVVRPVPVRRSTHPRAAVQRRRRVITRRRLMVSTFMIVGIFVGLWAGTGALVGSRGSSLVRLAGSVPDGTGYLYTARPGDTLWSIATRLDPSGDPRPLVISLNAELHGNPLQVGTKVIVP